jgi:hypothetical protein
VDEYSSRDLVALILSKIRSGELTDEQVQNLIKKGQSETQLAARRKVQGPTLQKLDQRMDQLSVDMRELRQTIKRMDDQRQVGFIRGYRPETGEGIAKFLRDSKFAASRLDDASETRFDRLLAELTRDGRSLQQVVEQAELVLILENLVRIVRSSEFSVPTEDFFRALKEEIAVMELPTSPPIYKVRDALSRRLGLSPREFVARLLECRTRGWIQLVEGAPFSESEDHWLDLDGRRFYYLEVVGGP